MRTATSCAGGAPPSAGVFVYQDPRCLGVLTAAGGQGTDRSQWRAWESSLSDVDGCLHLDSTEPLRPHMSLNSLTAPSLALVDAVARAGFEGKAEMIHHTAGAVF